MRYRLFGGCLCLVLYLMQSANGEAGAVSAATEAKATAAEAKAAAEQIAEEKRAAAELAAAEAAAAKAELDTADAIVVKGKAKYDLAVAEARIAELEAKVAQAEAVYKKALQAAKKAEAAEAEAKAILARTEAAAAVARHEAEKEAKVITDLAEIEAASLDKLDIDELTVKADEIAAKIEAATAKIGGKAEYAEKLAEIVDVKKDIVDKLADKRTEAVDAKSSAADTLADAKEALKDGLDRVTDAKIAVADAITAVEDTQTVEREAKAYVAALKNAKNVITDSYSFQWQNNFYYWQDGQDNSGLQNIESCNFYYSGKNIEAGLRTAYIFSKNRTSGRRGEVWSLSDTTLSLSHNNKHNNYSVRYSFDMNIPTGKATLFGDQRNAAMDEDLVEQGSFGEGWNFTPGVSISRKIGEEDTWTVGMNYAFRGKYNPNGDVANAEIEPGNLWIKNIKWLHAGQRWQMVGELKHVSYNTTRQGGAEYYRQGSEWDTSLAYNRELAKDRMLTLYYRYLKQRPYDAYDPVLAAEIGGKSVLTQYYGFMWSKTNDEKHTIRITGDIMKKSGRSYDSHTSLYIDGRTKYTLGLGYDIQFSPQRKLSIDIQQYSMENGASASTDYDGCNMFLKYQYFF